MYSKTQPVESLVPYAQLTFQVSTAVKVTPTLTVPDHHIAPSVAVLAAPK